MSVVLLVLVSWLGGTGADAMRSAREPVRIDGPCLSACALSFLINPQACFTKRATFGFHAPRDPGTDKTMPFATLEWLTLMSPDVALKVAPLLQQREIVMVPMSDIQPEKACK